MATRETSSRHVFNVVHTPTSHELGVSRYDLPRLCTLDPLTGQVIRASKHTASIKAVQRNLGHASAKMTLDVYGGLFEDDLNTLADRMETLYGLRE